MLPGMVAFMLINNDQTQRWVLNISGKPRETMGIQPGQYKLVFRAENALGSKYTKIYNFKIKSGTTKTLNLFGK